MEGGRVPRRDLSIAIARQLLAFGDPKIGARLEAVWGKIQPTSKSKAALVAKYKSLLGSSQDAPADPSRGRAVFNRTCLSCHKLFDAGGDVGPELTGSDRANPDYILENVLDPSAAVSRDYTLTSIATADGRLISGIVREQTEASLVIQTANERVVVPREDVEAIKPSNTSMMPEGLLDPLSPGEIRDLFAYLASSKQVLPPPEGKAAESAGAHSRYVRRARLGQTAENDARTASTVGHLPGGHAANGRRQCRTGDVSVRPASHGRQRLAMVQRLVRRIRNRPSAGRRTRSHWPPAPVPDGAPAGPA